ncbi:MAG: Response regulator consisting of a CheY-like receiver domain and a winged-helix DNA-binding domain [Pedosphaera sp.]|jgi:CheY-like chemotaxis protein|nr:Response regulator consisting of a CheY-like receiver domain and a winged-helix DNA-binding domain [Pedosphaera sp.]
MTKKILVVDDEYYMHRLMQHHLLRAGYSMVTARNGREALEKAAGEAPDLVIMDVMMAEMDGLTALKQLKETKATSEIPVIMITASAHFVTRQESESSGAAGFFTKPFSPTQLLLEIKRLLPEPVAP